MGNVIRDEQFAHTGIDAIVDIKSESFIPSTYNQSITIEDATEVFAIFGKFLGNCATDYTMITAGECGEVGLNSMMEWLKENSPNTFNDLLHAILYYSDEDELDEALEAAGWDNVPAVDVAIYVESDWLFEELGQETAEKFLNELSETLEAYLDSCGHSDLSLAIIEVDYDECNGDCECCGDCDDDEMLYGVIIAYDIPLDPEVAVELEGDIHEHVILRLLEKYNLVEEDDSKLEE